MSETAKGRKHHWRSASTRPEVAAKIKAWWTPERKEAKRRELLKRNPDARYHGLSARAAAKIVAEVGHCEKCAGDGGDSRLGVHHIDRDKHNQNRDNLQVLCHRCHMRLHSESGEIGWAAYHRNKTIQD
jgi:5-methylcytosine-specific restriction endonuclease McrA